MDCKHTLSIDTTEKKSVLSPPPKILMMKRTLSTTPLAPRNSVRIDLAEQVLRKRLKRDRHVENERAKRNKKGKLLLEDDKSSIRSINIDNFKFVNREVERFREWESNKSQRKRKPTSSSSQNKRSASEKSLSDEEKRIKTTSADTKPQTEKVENSARNNYYENCSLFRRRYQRGELPVTIEHNAGGLSLLWSRPLGSMKSQECFTLITTFLDGLR